MYEICRWNLKEAREALQSLNIPNYGKHDVYTPWPYLMYFTSYNFWNELKLFMIALKYYIFILNLLTIDRILMYTYHYFCFWCTYILYIKYYFSFYFTFPYHYYFFIDCKIINKWIVKSKIAQQQVPVSIKIVFKIWWLIVFSLQKVKYILYIRLNDLSKPEFPQDEFQLKRVKLK